MLAERLIGVLETLDEQWEVIFVDDGSNDHSSLQLGLLAASDDRLKIVSLARNFGHQIAITAGLDRAGGDVVVVMDGDLQDPPELIPDLLAKWREGNDVVYAVRRRREGEPLLRQLRAKLFYRVFRLFSDVDAPTDVGDFRAFDRRVLDVLLTMRERNRYLRGMVSWVGFRQTGVEYTREERYAGTSKYSFRKLLELGTNGFLSFSDAPLLLALRLGLVVSAASIVMAVCAVAIKIAGLFPIPGTATIVVLSALLGGVQLLILGVLGLYLGRIYDEVKGRPLYVVDRVVNLDDPTISHEGRAADARRRV